jgi:hypothetical protein
VLILSDVRSLGFHKRWDGLDDSSIAEALEGHEVFVLSSIIQPSSAEGKRSKLAVDELEQFLGSRRPEDGDQEKGKRRGGSEQDQERKRMKMRMKRKPEGDVGRVEAAHVVTALASFSSIALSSGSEGLDGVNLSFLHLASFLALGDGDRLSSVDAVRLDTVAIEVGDALDLEDLPVDLDLSGLHHFLNGCSNLRETGVNSGELIENECE